MLVTRGTNNYGERFSVISPVPARTYKGEFIVRVRFQFTGNEQTITIDQLQNGDFKDEGASIAPVAEAMSVEVEEIKEEAKPEPKKKAAPKKKQEEK